MNVTRNRALVDMLRNRTNKHFTKALYYSHAHDCPTCTLGHAMFDRCMEALGFPQCTDKYTIVRAAEDMNYGVEWFGWTRGQMAVITLDQRLNAAQTADYIEAELLREALEEAQAMRNALPAVAEFA